MLGFATEMAGVQLAFANCDAWLFGVRSLKPYGIQLLRGRCFTWPLLRAALIAVGKHPDRQ